MGVMNHLGIAEVRKEITHSLGYFGACFVILGAILVASGKTPKSTFIKESFHDCSKSTV
jgi:membrane associated rhomboid family serine protease